MSEIELGKIIEGQQQRDAIHVAVAPVAALDKLAPGQDVGFVGKGNQFAGVCDNPIGIVDPFLTSMVWPGQEFWLFLYPNTVTGMRHHWSHPTFDAEESAPQRPTQVESHEWLKSFADRAGLGYDRLIEIVKEYVDTGEPWCEYSGEKARDAFDDLEDKGEFWLHFQNMTGIGDPKHDWDAPFTCSC